MSKRISFADIAVNTALVLLSATAAVLLCIYLFGGKTADDNPSDLDPPHIINAAEADAPQTFITTVTEATAVSEEAAVSEPETETTPEPEAGEYSPAFFEKTLFIGDSISVGFINYEFLPSENVFAKAGITPSSVVTTKIDNISVFDKAAGLDPEYICLMLGTNSVAYVDGQQMSDELSEFIDMIADTCPNAKIVLASIPPVTQKHEEEKPEHLEAIVEYNKLVEKLAEDKSIAYADTFSLLKDETGYLGPHYAEQDGLHLKIHAYPVILGTVQNALIKYYDIDFVPPAETEEVSEKPGSGQQAQSAETAASAAGTVFNETAVHGTEVPEETVTDDEDELENVGVFESEIVEDTDELI